MKYLRLLIVNLISFALLALNFGSVAYSQSLQEALGLAYVNNPTLNAERAGVRAVRKTRAQAIARFFPTLSATASYGDRGIDLNPTKVVTESKLYADLRDSEFSDLCSYQVVTCISS